MFSAVKKIRLIPADSGSLTVFKKYVFAHL